jgi:hypothetical protein
MTTAAVAVVLPCHNSRHLLWRSLASVAAQTVPPAQILVLDRGSSDGLSDWLRARWPGVEHRAVPADADAATVGAVVAGAVATAAVAVLQPGDRWDRDCLAALTGARPAPRDEVSGGLVANSDLATPAGAAALASPSRHEPQASPHSLQDAIASLPAASEAILLDLRAASRPLALLNLLGLASLLASSGRSIRALSLADLTWPALEAAPQATPLLVSLGTPLDLRSASEQLCIEELIRRANDRPVRLVLAGLCPTTPQQLSRLLGAALAHPDLELWLGDAVSRRLAASLLGRGRVRLVSPSSLALAPAGRARHAGQPGAGGRS